MYSSKNNSFKKGIKAIRQSYALALAILLILAFANYAIVKRMIKNDNQMLEVTSAFLEIQSNLIKLQDTVELVLRTTYQQSNNPVLIQKAQARMLMQTKNVEDSYALFLKKNNQGYFSELQSSQIHTFLYKPPYNINLELTTLLKDMKALATLDPDLIYWRFNTWAPIQAKLSQHNVLAKGIHLIGIELYQQSIENSKRLSTIHNILIFISLLTFLAEAYYIFIPLMRRLYIADRRLMANYNRLHKHAYTDMLTRIGNRRALNQQLISLKNDKDNNDYCLMMLDLNGFKNINDVYGHVMGDHILIQVSEKIKKWLADNGNVYRMGGDEFAIVIKNQSMLKSIHSTAASLLSKINEPIAHEKNVLVVRACIGVAQSSPINRSNASDLLKEANFSLLSAAKAGHNSIRVYSIADYYEASRLEQLGKDLKIAILNGQLTPYYQPIIQISTGEVICAEALVRWDESLNQVAHQAEIIQAIMDNSLMISMSESLLQKVAVDRSLFLENGVDIKKFSVNFTEHLLVDEKLPKRLCALLESNSLDWLTIEIVENALINKSKKIVRENLLLLQRLGAHIALDDFGTGYGSLSDLRDLPCQYIKIDQSFVKDILTDRNAQLIVRGMIGLAYGLGMGVVVEGVETAQQYNFFKEWPNIAIQGFYFSKAMPKHEFIVFCTEKKYLSKLNLEDKKLK